MILLLRKYIKHKQIMTRGAQSFITIPKAADCWCHTYTNLGDRQHIGSRKNFWRTLPHLSLQLVTRLQQVLEDTNIFWGTIVKMLLTWLSVMILLKMSYGENMIFLCHTQHCLRLYTAAQIMWAKVNQKILPLESWKLLKPLWRIIQK